MTKTRVILVACFLAAFAAGAAAGVAFMMLRAKPPAPESMLARELHLTEEQQKQMQQIWSTVMSAVRAQDAEQRQALRDKRDEAVQQLLSEEQKKQYDEIMKAFAEKSAALAEERAKAFEEAVRRTKAILTEPQRAKYDELLKERRGWHRRRSPGGGPEKEPPRFPGGPPGDGPERQPPRRPGGPEKAPPSPGTPEGM